MLVCALMERAKHSLTLPTSAAARNTDLSRSKFARSNESVSTKVCFRREGSVSEGRSRGAAQTSFLAGDAQSRFFLSLGQSAQLRAGAGGRGQHCSVWPLRHPPSNSLA